MPKSTSWVKTRWLHIPLGVWAIAFVVLVAGGAILSSFVVRRQVAEYPMGHRFAVRDPAFISSAHSMADPLPCEGNKIELLNNGDEIFPAMLAAIRSAQKSINFEAFLYESGTVGTQFREALRERAKAGVKVRVLLDGVGSGSALKGEDVKAFRAGGCEFLYYHPTRSWRIDQLNRRTHRRVLVIDGRIGFTGGVGFADQWQGKADSKDHWRDVHARLEGPIVTRLQSAFQKHWIKSGGESLSGPEDYPVLERAGNLKAQMVASESFSFAPLAHVLSVAFSSAEKSIFITNAYCAPSDSEVRLLCEAVKRGVKVQLLLPGKHNDQPLTKAAGRTAYGELLEGGVEIFEYTPTMIHSKTLVIDGIFSIFGTSNFDARSSQINEEIDITVYDEAFAKMMEAAFVADVAKSKPYLLEDFKRRGPWERFSEWLMLPFHSQM
ncbi:MAG TPA: phospholipase D-like domain-containing protein [Chthoniobacterales bacterium]|jgi:cardiolipin synthase